MLRNEEGHASWDRASGWRHKTSCTHKANTLLEWAVCQLPPRANLALSSPHGVVMSSVLRPPLLMAQITQLQCPPCKAHVRQMYFPRRHAGVCPAILQSSSLQARYLLKTTYSTPHWFALYPSTFMGALRLTGRGASPEQLGGAGATQYWLAQAPPGGQGGWRPDSPLQREGRPVWLIGCWRRPRQPSPRPHRCRRHPCSSACATAAPASSRAAPPAAASPSRGPPS